MKKSFKEIFEKMLSKPISKELSDEIGDLGIKTQKRATGFDAIAMIQMKKALSGDIKSFELIRNTVDTQEEEKTDNIIRVQICDE